MRSILVACLLAGCYQPTTESCYYRCAAGANPCPSGLECSAGMCATPGTNCSASGDGAGSDAVSDSLPGIDGAPPMCGNGIAVVGEICYRQPLAFDTPGALGFPVDGVLGDYDRDGDLDLIYLQTGTNGAVQAYLQTLGSFSPTMPGPALGNPTFLRAFDLDASSPSVELIVGSGSGITTFGYSGGPMMISTLTDSTIGSIATIANVTNGPITDVVTVGTSVSVYRYNASFMLSRVSSTGTSGGLDVSAGRLTNDGFADVAIGGTSGITLFQGMSSGLSSSQLLMTSPVNELEVGDINDDGFNDIVFVVNDGGSGMPGKIGVMRGAGDGTFAAASTTSLVNLGGALAMRDIDGDGSLDVITVRTGLDRALAIFRGRSDGLLEPPVFVALPGASAQLSVRGDFNNDSIPDIVVTDRVTRRIYVFPSDP